MKQDTVIIGLKGFCLIGGATLAALNVGLSQWSNEPVTPSLIQWIMIISGSISAGLLAASAFLSSAWNNYIKGQREMPEVEEKK
jgi:hypothetical protein